MVEERLAERCVRVLVEPREQDAAAALATVAAVDAVLDAAGADVQRVYHGCDAAAWRSSGRCSPAAAPCALAWRTC